MAGALLSLGLCAPLAAQDQSAPSPRQKPAAPPNQYVSEADESTLNLFFEALERRRWSVADSYRPRIDDDLARAIADWAWFRADPDDLDWRAVGRFIDTHPDWPNDYVLQRNAEEAMPDDAPADDVLAFFAAKEPVSGYGKIALARALIETADLNRGKLVLRDAWINHNWPDDEERALGREFSRYLSEADHYEKADRQLFDIIATDTRALLDYLEPGHRQMAEARIALLRRDGNAESLLRGLSDEQRRDSGVLHAATRYYRRGDNEPTALTYAAQAPTEPDELRDADGWWTERRLLMRWALTEGLPEEAYLMAAYSGLDEGGDFAEAEFFAGWIALRFLERPADARRHFAYLEANVGSPISKARAHYWLARAYAAEGNDARASQYYRAAAAHPYTFYGQLAQENLPDSARLFPPVVTPSEEDYDRFNNRDLVQAMRILAEIGEDYPYIAFARQLDDVLTSPGEYAAYEQLVAREDMLFLSVRAGKAAVSRNIDAPSVSYPLLDVPDAAAGFTEKPLILGLSRQESEFNPRAYSSASARGLMQLLPSTAQLTARKEGLAYSTDRLMDDPSYNMLLGSAHLSHLIDRFDGSYVMTLAGYNAGPGRVNQWVERYGDPRNPDVDPVDWIELIPFEETRNYVQRVLENVQIYRARLEERPIAGRLSADLVRGGGTKTAIGLTPPIPVLAAKAQQWNGEKLIGNALRPQASPAAYAVDMPNPAVPAPDHLPPLLADTPSGDEPIAECIEVADAEALNEIALEGLINPTTAEC